MVTKDKKQAVITRLKEGSENASIAFLANYKGLSMEKLSKLRKALNGKAKCMVAKNTLMRVAFHESEFASLEKFLEGPNMLVLAEGDPSAAIKSFMEERKKLGEDALPLQGGIIAGDITPLDGKALEDISKLPSREFILAQIAAALVAVPSTLAQSINQTISSLGELSVQVAEKQEG